MVQKELKRQLERAKEGAKERQRLDIELFRQPDDEQTELFPILTEKQY